MHKNFPQAFEWLLESEGGFVNHPRDPGGATNCGVTQKTYDKFRDKINQPMRGVEKMTLVECEQIYRMYYWRAVQGDVMPSGLDYVLFDTAVLVGETKTNAWLLNARNEFDAGIKPLFILRTVEGLELPMGKIRQLIDSVLLQRTEYLKSRPHARTFIKGWLRRIVVVRSRAYLLV